MSDITTVVVHAFPDDLRFSTLCGLGGNEVASGFASAWTCPKCRALSGVKF